MASDIILEFKGITKCFPGVQALKDINLDVRRGEVLAIMGENGAGKSTLMKIAAGLYHPDRGSTSLNGTPVSITDAQKALQLGIGMVPQELNLVPDMRVSENVLLGIEPRNAAGMILRNKLRQRATEILASLDIDVDCDTTVKALSVAQQQMIQIARALANQCQILIMDEPTAALSHRETDLLLRKIRLLRDGGTTILYISHRIREVKAIADRIAVLRDGELVSVGQCAELTEDDITQQMIGRPLKEFMVDRETKRAPGKSVLRVKDLSDTKNFHDVSFDLHEGEILGFAGLVGAGRSEVFSSIFGFRDFTHGEIWIDERKLEVRSPADAIRNGIGYVPEERKRQGLFLLLGVLENVSMPFVKRFQKFPALHLRQERENASKLSEQLHVKTPSLNQPVRFLSGGNQQKVILARWLGSGVRILILDEPTRGIDVNAKAEIHALIADLAAQGKAVVVISSEAQELMAIADRIIIMREGRVVGEVNPNTSTEEDVLRIAMWGNQERTAMASDSQPA